MSSVLTQYHCNPPVVIGGIGGSGTRIVAQSLLQLGYSLGVNLNRSHDNLWFSLLFKRADILSCSDDDFDETLERLLVATQHPGRFAGTLMKLLDSYGLADRPNVYRNLLRSGATHLLSTEKPIPTSTLWGWKEPNSHVVLDRLVKRLPGMNYIHVVRNGLDMAYSKNQQQLRLWGRYYIGDVDRLGPRESLKFWCAVQRRALHLGETMGGKFFYLNYDEFCLFPMDTLQRLTDFLGLQVNNEKLESISQLVRPPVSAGRFKHHGIDVFDQIDIDYVSTLGFDVEPQQRSSVRTGGR